MHGQSVASRWLATAFWGLRRGSRRQKFPAYRKFLPTNILKNNEKRAPGFCRLPVQGRNHATCAVGGRS